MKRWFGISLLIASTFVFAQEPVSADSTKANNVEQAATAEVPANEVPQVAADSAASDGAAVASAKEAVADTTKAIVADSASSPSSNDVPATAAPAEAALDSSANIPATAQADAAKATGSDSTELVATAVATSNVESAVDSASAISTPQKQEWNFLLGVGLTVPVSQYKAHDKKVDLVDYGINVSYLAIAPFGMTFKLSLATGYSFTDNIRFVDSHDDWQMGSFSTAEFGLGFSLGNVNSFSISILAVAGFTAVDFESDEKRYTHPDLGEVDRTYTESMGAVTLGGDITAYVALTKRIGLFANVGGRWVAENTTATSVRYEKDSYTRTETTEHDECGNYSIVPALGAMWRF